MKRWMTMMLVVISTTTWAQQQDERTREFVVTGEIKKELKFTFADIERLPAKALGDVVITNHMGEPRGTATRLSGVLVKDLLQDLALDEASPKRFSEFYLTFVASDNYKVVYSWNEIFNSPTGENLYLITSRDGKKMQEMEESILILTPTDLKTGRRHIKGLSKIVVRRVD